MGKQMQFEIWQECNSRCAYCYLCKENRNTPKSLKIKALNGILNTLNHFEDYDGYDTIGFIGGEFFQGQLSDSEVKEKFMQVMDKSNELLENGLAKEVWIYATMTIGDQKDLYETIEKFSDKSKLWILTSYDTIGRYHTQKMFDTWDYHMKHIHELYPDIKLNTTTILTGDFIEKYLRDEIILKEFMEKYHTSLFFKQCGAGSYTKQEMNDKVGNFFPKRKDFLKFLGKFKKTEDDYMWYKLFNIHFRADSLYRNFNENGRQMELTHRFKEDKVETDNPKENAVNKCGHLMSYAAYIDSDDCVLCDKHKIESISC